VASERDVQTVRAAFEAWAAGEPGADEFDPDVEVVMPHPGMSGRGLDRMRSSMRDFRAMWGSYAFELEDVRATPDGRVLALFTERVRGAASGIEQVATPGVVCTVREGRIVRFEAHLYRDDALRAAGLRE
jgi:ketosteroid isomerase-like protein